MTSRRERERYMNKYLIKSATYYPEDELIQVVFRDAYTVLVNVSWFTYTNSGLRPDPFNLKITDGGQTLCLGDYEAAADAIREEYKEMKPKTITARDAYAIYEEAIEKKNLMLRSLWEKTYATKLDKLIREQAEFGYTSVTVEYATWRPMKNFIEDLGYKVNMCPEDLSMLEVSWNKI